MTQIEKNKVESFYTFDNLEQLIKEDFPNLNCEKLKFIRKKISKLPHSEIEFIVTNIIEEILAQEAREKIKELVDQAINEFSKSKSSANHAIRAKL